MATAAAQVGISPGWVDFVGGFCPVDPHARVQVQFRSDPDRTYAEQLSRPQGTAAHAYRWTLTGGPGDIVAYRVVF